MVSREFTKSLAFFYDGSRAFPAHTGMAINLLVMSVCFVYGEAAFPEGQGVKGARGTTTTCDVQGFLIYFGLFSALLYYSFFSMYSYLCVSNNYQVSRFGWVEKYIHVVAHLFPLASAVFDLTMQNFNPSTFGFCIYSSRYPLFCESPSSNNAPCERGSPETTHHMTTLIAEIFILVFPTITMLVLYFTVKKNQSNICLPARSVANQAFLYLLVLYLVVLPLIIGQIFGKLGEKRNYRSQMWFVSWVTVINILFFGLYSLAVYRYFSGGTYYRQHTAIVVEDGNRRKSTAEASASEARTEDYSFDIFDGTNAGGAFAGFIHDGDDDDEADDEKETRHWEGMQGL